MRCAVIYDRERGSTSQTWLVNRYRSSKERTTTLSTSLQQLKLIRLSRVLRFHGVYQRYTSVSNISRLIYPKNDSITKNDCRLTFVPLAALGMPVELSNIELMTDQSRFMLNYRKHKGCCINDLAFWHSEILYRALSARGHINTPASRDLLSHHVDPMLWTIFPTTASRSFRPTDYIRPLYWSTKYRPNCIPNTKNCQSIVWYHSYLMYLSLTLHSRSIFQINLWNSSPSVLRASATMAANKSTTSSNPAFSRPKAFASLAYKHDRSSSFIRPHIRHQPPTRQHATRSHSGKQPSHSHPLLEVDPEEGEDVGFSKSIFSSSIVRPFNLIGDVRHGGGGYKTNLSIKIYE